MRRSLNFKEKILRFTKRSKKKTDKYIWQITVVMFILLLGVSWIQGSTKAVEEVRSDDTVFVGTMVGDMMFGRHIEEVVDRHGYDYLFRHVKPYFQNADYAVGNFESAVLDENEEYIEQEKNIHLSANSDSVSTLKEQNFSVISLANNHTMDYLEKGVVFTLETFEKNQLPTVGAGLNFEDAKKIDYHEVNGITVATLAFSDVTNPGSPVSEYSAGILMAQPEIFMPLIKEASLQADLVVVNVHWGEEYETEASPRQKDLAKAMSDAGADLILGSHPHVLQPIDYYNGTVIFYSLGNFIFDQGWSATRESAIVQYKLDKNGEASFEVTPVLIKEGAPTLLSDADWYYEKKIFRRLTKDSPDSLNATEVNGKLVFTVDHKEVLNGQ